MRCGALGKRFDGKFLFLLVRLEKTFNALTGLQKTYGTQMAKAITKRMAVLKHARHLGMVPTTRPERRHQLSADRDSQFAVDLVHPHRLVFEPDHHPLPRKDDKGIDLEQVTAIRILDVIDYH